ncbi:hypothetical protein BDV11DRAFT_180776 [Aspergillus similis]
MLKLFSFFLCTLSAVRVVGITLYEPLDGATCFTNDFTIQWDIGSDEYVTAFTADIIYSDGSSTTATTFSPMDMDSSTVLPAKFLPALRPGETSDIEMSLYTTEKGLTYGFYITDIALVAPTPTTATVTVTSKDTLHVTLTTTLFPTASATDSESSATASGSASEEDHNGSGGLSNGAKAGIGVGVSAGFLVIIAAGGLLWLRYQRRKKEDRIPVIAAPASNTATERPLSEPEAKSSILPSITPDAVERPRDARYEMEA